MRYDMSQRRVYMLCVQALRAMGGRTATIQRTPTDPNGVPSGEPTPIAALYGIVCRKGQSSQALVLAIPGVTLGGDNDPRYLAVRRLDDEGQEPAKGDALHVNGKAYTIVDVTLHMGVLHELRLQEDTAIA